jgi:adenine-specific DNA-methyltransferase
LDEVCGSESYIATNVWQKRYSRENRGSIGDSHEYVLVYARNPKLFSKVRNQIPFTDKQAAAYRNPNNDPKGRWRSIPITAQAGHATSSQFYEITSPSGKVFKPPSGCCWGLSKKGFEDLLAEGRVYFGIKGDSCPSKIRYLSEVDGVTPWTWWPHEEVGHTDEAKKESQVLFGKEASFGTPKPERLIHRILTIATNPGDLVVDAFAGSGTTGAVAQKMGRHWILIENGNHCLTHIIPRMQQVIDGIDQGGVTSECHWTGGGGFQLFRVDELEVVEEVENDTEDTISNLIAEFFP